MHLYSFLQDYPQIHLKRKEQAGQEIVSLFLLPLKLDPKKLLLPETNHSLFLNVINPIATNKMYKLSDKTEETNERIRNDSGKIAELYQRSLNIIA